MSPSRIWGLKWTGVPGPESQLFPEAAQTVTDHRWHSGAAMLRSPPSGTDERQWPGTKFRTIFQNAALTDPNTRSIHNQGFSKAGGFLAPPGGGPAPFSSQLAELRTRGG